MAFLSELWLAILVAAAAVFVVSSVVHMLLPVHKGECRPVPDEERVRRALREAGVKPGEYRIPHAGSVKEMGTPAVQAKLREGPVAYLIVAPDGAPRMGRSLLQWFAYSLVVGVFAAYLTRYALPPGAPYLSVFRLSGTVAVLGYAAGEVQDSIWKARPWGTTLRYVFDGLLYGLTTAGVFASMWPAA